MNGPSTSTTVSQVSHEPEDRWPVIGIPFGTDLSISPDHWQLGSVSETPVGIEDAVKFYQAHFRFFETDLKNIDHPTRIQGRWKVNASTFPGDVLHKLYYVNTLRSDGAVELRQPLVSHCGGTQTQPLRTNHLHNGLRAASPPRQIVANDGGRGASVKDPVLHSSKLHLATTHHDDLDPRKHESKHGNRGQALLWSK
jgi:hypothetical protein